MNAPASDAQQRINLSASAYLDVIRAELALHYGDQWDRFPEKARQAAMISSAVQTLILTAVLQAPMLDAGIVFGNIGTALGVHTAHLPDEAFTALMGSLAIGAGQGRAHRVATVLNFPTVGNA